MVGKVRLLLVQDPLRIFQFAHEPLAVLVRKDATQQRDFAVIFFQRGPGDVPSCPGSLYPIDDPFAQRLHAPEAFHTVSRLLGDAIADQLPAQRRNAAWREKDLIHGLRPVQPPAEGLGVESHPKGAESAGSCGGQIFRAERKRPRRQLSGDPLRIGGKPVQRRVIQRAAKTGDVRAAPQRQFRRIARNQIGRDHERQFRRGQIVGRVVGGLGPVSPLPQSGFGASRRVRGRLARSDHFAYAVQPADQPPLAERRAGPFVLIVCVCRYFGG